MKELLSAGPAIAHVSGNHYILITRIAEDGTVAYLEPNKGPEGETLEMTRATLEQIWEGYLLAPRAPPRAWQILSTQEAQQITGSDFISALIAITVAIASAIAAAVSAIIAAVTTLLASLGSLLSGIFQAFGAAFTGLFEGFSAILSGNLLGGLTSIGQGLLNGVIGFAKAGLDFLGLGSLAKAGTWGAFKTALADFAFKTVLSTGANYGVTRGLEALGLDPGIASLVGAFAGGFVAGGLPSSTGSAAGEAAKKAATTGFLHPAVAHGLTSTAIQGTSLGLTKAGLDPALASLAGIGVGTITSSLISGVNIYDPATGVLKDHLTGLNALGYTLSTQLAPTLAGELAFYGIQRLGESVGLDPRLSQLAGMPIKGAFNPRAFDATDTLTGIQRGLLEGAASVGLQFGIQELELDPLVGALAGNVIAGVLEGAVTGRGIFQGIGTNLQRALGQFAGIGDLSGNPVEGATQLAKLNDFSNIVREQGLSAALETYAASILHRTSVESLVTSYGSVKEAVVNAFTSDNADGTKTYDLGGGVSVTVDEATGQIKEITEPNATTTGVLEANTDTISAGLKEGTQTYTTADGHKVTVEVKNRLITKVAVRTNQGNYFLTGDELNSLSFTPQGRLYSGTVKDADTGVELTFRDGQIVNRLTPAAILVYTPGENPNQPGTVQTLGFEQADAFLEETYGGQVEGGQLRLVGPGQGALENAPANVDPTLLHDAKEASDEVDRAMDPPDPTNPNDFKPSFEAVPGKDLVPMLQAWGIKPGQKVIIVPPAAPMPGMGGVIPGGGVGTLGGPMIFTMPAQQAPAVGISLYIAQMGAGDDENKPPPGGGDTTPSKGPHIGQRLWDRIWNKGRAVQGWEDLQKLGGNLDYNDWKQKYLQHTYPNSSWRGGPIERTIKFTKELKDKFNFSRVWGGSTPEKGSWVSPESPSNRSNAKKGYSLPPGNTAENISDFDPPDGTELRVQIGESNALFGHEGGKIQIRILDQVEDGWFKNRRTLPE